MKCFEKDDDGHWYMIDVSDRKTFEKWVQAEGDLDGVDFDDCRCMHPSCYMFKEVKEIKE